MKNSLDKIFKDIKKVEKNKKLGLYLNTNHIFSYNNKGIKDLNNYINSRYFFNTCRIIRSKYSKDHIFLIAGACQSNFEAMIASGCNFAMSKKRVNIHALDPAIVAIKAATTPFDKILYPKEIFDYTVSKNNGIGGIESYGKMRLLF